MDFLLDLPVDYLNALSHGFTKMAVSPLIMVRFWKFKFCHTQDFDPDLSDISYATRNVTRARWRHARDDVLMTFPGRWRHDKMHLTTLASASLIMTPSPSRVCYHAVTGLSLETSSNMEDRIVISRQQFIKLKKAPGLAIICIFYWNWITDHWFRIPVYYVLKLMTIHW